MLNKISQTTTEVRCEQLCKLGSTCANQSGDSVNDYHSTNKMQNAENVWPNDNIIKCASKFPLIHATFFIRPLIVEN